MAEVEKDPIAEAIIQRALEEEEAEKQRRKSSKQNAGLADKTVRKGLTLEELESQEGGPIKESLVGMAQTRRAANRKGKGVADTDLVQDVEAAEEELEAGEGEDDGGVKLEAFNLKEEREHGYFDESGMYVEKKDEEEADAWLDSEEAKVVDDRTLQRIQAQQRRMEEAEVAAPPTAMQLARLQWQVAQLLEEGETVAGALRRLGGHSKRPAKRPKRTASGAEPSAPTHLAPDPEAKARFERLTEAASALVDAGETDVYSHDRGYFKRAASVYIDIEDGPGGAASLLAGPATGAYEEADEDMFAEDDQTEGGEGSKSGDAGKEVVVQPEASLSGGKAAPQQAALAPPAAGGDAGGEDRKEDTTDYGSWPIKELRRFLVEREQDATGIVEKGELVAKVQAAAASSAPPQPPPGYAFDPGSGLWHSQQSGMYWDSTSGGYYNSTDGKWYAVSEQGAWVAWPQQP